jgi:hypothetical protein
MFACLFIVGRRVNFALLDEYWDRVSLVNKSTFRRVFSSSTWKKLDDIRLILRKREENGWPVDKKYNLGYQCRA